MISVSSFHFSIRYLTILQAGMVGGLLACMVGGCQREEPIRQYRVPEDVLVGVPQTLVEDEREVASDRTDAEQGASSKGEATVADATPTDRMLAALVTTPTRVWSFKLVGPIEAVGGTTHGFRSLLESIEFVPDPENPDQKVPSWKLPNEWVERPGSQMRFATLLPDSTNESLFVSVIGLPNPQDPMANVNRWRGQLQLPPLAEGTLAENSETIQVGEHEGIFVDLMGTVAPGGMMGPMGIAGQPSGRFPPGGGPPGGRGIEGPPPSRRELTVTAPEGWKTQEPQMFQTHRWEITRGDQTGECTISRLGAAGADMLANVNRWRSQIGLEPIEEAGLSEFTTDVTIDGTPSKVVTLRQPESNPAGQGIVTAVAIRGETAWFIKLRGPQTFVDAERAGFDALCQSIDFQE